MKKRGLVAVAAVAGAFALLRNRVAIKESIDWELIDKPGTVVEIDGYGVHYIDRGSGPAIVLVHGFGGQTYSYRSLIPILARDHRVIAVDLKGYGYSERSATAGLSHTDQAEMLYALLAKLGIERAVFVGHSMGGGIVQRLAARHPDCVDALVLAASVTGEERFSRRTLPALIIKPLMPLLAGIAARRIYNASFYDRSLASPEHFAEYIRPATIKGSMDGLLASMRDSARDEPIAAERITCPVLLLYGADDRAVPLSAAQRIRERTPSARLVVIDKAGHLLLEEKPEECAATIVDFLRESHLAMASTTT